jgi:RNA polymerase sigma factor (sigma-70 family)
MNEQEIQVPDEKMHNVRIEFRAKNHILMSEREKRGLSQAEMAEELGIPLNVYAGAERYERVARHWLVKIAAIMRLDPAILFPEWASTYAFAINSGKKYFICDDEAARNIVENRSDPTMIGLMKESFEIDLRGSLSYLSEREAQVIKLFFGIGSEHSLTLEEIGEKFNLTRERVRQIRERAIRRLRHARSSKRLRPYLGEDFSDNERRLLESVAAIEEQMAPNWPEIKNFKTPEEG